MNTHIIENGVVVNTIITTVEEAQEVFPTATCIEATIGGIGWVWDGFELAPPVVSPPPLYVPESITPRQGRVILAQQGLLSAVDDYFNTLTGEGADVAKIEWEYAQEWRRDWPALMIAAQSFGLSTEQIDQMFIAGSKI